MDRFEYDWMVLFSICIHSLPILGQSISGQGLSNDIDIPLPQSDKFLNSNIYNVMCIYIYIYIYIYISFDKWFFKKQY